MAVDPRYEARYSRDGRYIWDGSQWQLAGSAPPRGWRPQPAVGWRARVPFLIVLIVVGAVSQCALVAAVAHLIGP